MDILYVKLSAMMFMEYAVWGAWMPVLAARLLGPLKMTGKQTGWIYATLPIGTMISPLIAGQLADKYVDTGWILAVCHLLGAVLLFAAARIEKFTPLFLVMLLYSMFYGATIPLVNSLMFTPHRGYQDRCNQDLHVGPHRLGSRRLHALRLANDAKVRRRRQ